MATQTTTQTKPIGQGYSENNPCICIQDYETNKWVWFDVYEIFQNSNDLEEFGELMKKARKSVARDEWFYSDCLYLNSIYSENIMDYELYEYLESLDDALSNGYSVSLHEEFIGNLGTEYYGMLNELYYGEFDNTKEFAEHYIEDTEDLDSIPWIIRSNIDYSNIWYDLQDDFIEIEANRSNYFFKR